MKTEITPKSWLRFGNVINTSEKISISNLQFVSQCFKDNLVKFTFSQGTTSKFINLFLINFWVL